MTTSHYLMRLRVLAQSCVVGAVMVGAVFASYGDSKNEDQSSG